MFNDYSQLLIDVQNKSNIRVSNVRDLKYLKEEIDSKSNKPIGFNTMRRLFGFLDKTKPSITTLNTLSNYLGFSSFSSYANHQSNYSEWYFQQSLMQIKRQKKIGKQEINEINNGLLDERNIVYLAYFLSYQVEQNNIEILDSIFKYVDFKNITGTQFHKFTTSISISLLQVSEKKALHIYEKLMHHDTFRSSVPLLFIDYSNLKSRYFKILKIVEKNTSDESDLLFVLLMTFYKNFYTENKSYLAQELKKPPGFSNFHSALKGRFYGCCIIQAQELSFDLKKEILKECSSIRVSFFLEEIVPALIIKNEYEFLKKIIDKYYEELFESDVWSSPTTNSLYLIGLSNINWYFVSYKSAKSNLELVALNRVEIAYHDYIALFYYLTKMKISFSENERRANLEAFKNLKFYVKKTGFTLFLRESKGYCL
jgi:hypothetical protein